MTAAQNNKITSLAEAQLVSYRDKIKELEAQLEIMYQIAENNQTVIDKIIHFDQALLAAADLEAVLLTVKRELTVTFNFPCHVLKLCGGYAKAGELAASCWVHDSRLQSRIEALPGVSGGTFNLEPLFYQWLTAAAPAGYEPESYLQLPLGLAGSNFGILLIGHDDPDYFTADAPTDYVNIMRRSLAVVLNRWLNFN